MEACRCTVCGEGGHHPRKCPSLSDPLQEGFYKGQIPRGGGGEEEDDHLRRGLRVGNDPVSIFLHTKNLRIPHQPVVMKKIESFKGLL